MVLPQSQLYLGLNSFSCSDILPSVPPGPVSGPPGFGRSLQSGSVSICRSESGKSPRCEPGSAMLTAGPEKESLCLPQSLGALSQTSGLLEREFPALILCAPLPVSQKQAFGAMSTTGPLKVSRIEKMKENLPSERSFSGSIYDMKVHF